MSIPYSIPFSQEPSEAQAPADFPPAVLHLSDRDLLCAMSVSLCCPDWPDAGRVNDWLPGVSQSDLRWARMVYEQSCVFQGADVDRLIAASDFRDPDTHRRLRETWGAPEALPAESLPFWAEVLASAAQHCWRVPAACLAFWLFVVLVLGGLGR